MNRTFCKGFEKMGTLKSILKKIIPDVSGRGDLASQIKKTRKLRDTYSKSAVDIDTLHEQTSKSYPGSNALDKMREAKKGYQKKKDELNQRAKELLKSAGAASFANKLRIGSTVTATGKAAKTLNMSVPKGPQVKIIKPGLHGPNRT